MFDFEAFATDVWNSIVGLLATMKTTLQHLTASIGNFLSSVVHIIILLLFWLLILYMSWIILYIVSKTLYPIWHMIKQRGRRNRAERQPLLRRHDLTSRDSAPRRSPFTRAGRAAWFPPTLTRQGRRQHPPMVYNSRLPPRREPHHARRVPDTLQVGQQHGAVVRWWNDAPNAPERVHTVMVYSPRRMTYGTMPSLPPPAYDSISTAAPPSYDSQACRRQQSPPPPYA